MEPLDILSPITLLEMDVQSILSGNFLSTTMSNFWDCMTNPGGVGFSFSPTSWITLRPQGGAVPIITVRTGEVGSMMPIALLISPDVLPLTPVLLNCRGVL